MRRHMARSSSQIAVAPARSRSHSAAPSPGVAAASRAIRSSAQRRFTAVGLAAASSSTSRPNRARNASRGATRSSRVPATRPIAAAIPISGAPRTWRVRTASATASTLSRSRSMHASGSARWSTMRTAPEGLQAMAWTGMAANLPRGPQVRNADCGLDGLGSNPRMRFGPNPANPQSAFCNPQSPCAFPAMACHLRIASEHARFGQPEVKLGIAPGYGGTQRLPRIVGKGNALYLILTAELIDAHEAHRIGLVNKVVPPGELLATTEQLLRSILSMGPLAVRLALEAVDQGLEMTLEG